MANRTVVAVLGMCLSVTAAAQTAADHTAHHPDQAAPVTGAPATAPLQQPPQQPPLGPQLGGCGGMMGCMMRGGRPFYPALLDMPTLTPEARRFIEQEAGRRVEQGARAIGAAELDLHRGIQADDPVAVQRAAAAMREGLLGVESGAAALRAVDEGQAPRQIALAWFRDQLALTAAETPPSAGPWGMSWYHFVTMAFLVVFMAGSLALQFARMQRVRDLVARLAGGGTAVAPPLPAAAAASAGDKPAAESVPPDEAAWPTTGAPGPAAAAAAAKRPWIGTLKVADIFDETATVKTFRLVEPGGGEVPFAFMPGQFLIFSAEVDGKRARRAYTIASAPTQRGYVEVTVKREEHGLISRHLHDQVAVGDVLDVSAPSGVFTFMGEEASIVLIAGGVGITPMMSVTRYLTDRSFPCEIFFLYGARSPDDVVFREELQYLQKRHPNLHVAITVSHPEGTGWTGATGRISQEFIAGAVPDIAARRVHLCGPPAMMETVNTALAALGVPRSHIKTEAFGPAQGVVPGPAAPLPSATAVTTDAAPVPRVATAEVRFARSGKVAPLAPAQTVLEAAEGAGVAIDYSCRVGICGACKVQLLEGAVTMEVEEGLEPAEKAAGIILACQARSVGNLAVEA